MKLILLEKMTKLNLLNVLQLDLILIWYVFLAVSIDHPISKFYQDRNEFKKFKEECSKTGTTEEAIASS